MEKGNDFFSNMTARQQGRLLFAQGLAVADIAKHLNENPSTVQSWKQRDGWEKADIFDDVTLGLRARMLSLIFMERKGNPEYKEIDFMMELLLKAARIERYRSGEGNEVDLNPNLANRNNTPKKKKLRNQITAEQLEKLEDLFNKLLYSFQTDWLDALKDTRIFILLKSRQIGATYIIALWALIDALKTGNNKIFLSASKAQAYQFIEYIKEFVFDALEINLVGEPMKIHGPAGQVSFYWLGTNKLTAQGRHGDVITDEFFWIRNFKSFRNVASGMASQNMYKQIYLSTPSSVLHEAYAFWTGTDGERKLPFEIDVSHQALKKPVKCVDRKTRQIVTLDDAEAAGYDKFNRDDLVFENSDDEFANKYLAQFIDDSGSYFPLAITQPNMVDAGALWRDFSPFSSRPYNGQVWLGYDPSYTGDKAALVVIAPPNLPNKPYRILEVQQFRNLSPQEQALAIKKVCGRYNVTFMGIDNTGNGLAVAEHTVLFYPALTRLNYNPDLKIRMGLRAKELFQKRKLQYEGQTVPKSFMAVKKTMTKGGGHLTLSTNRTLENGHGDVAWAVMNALEGAPIIYIPDQSISNARQSRIRVY
jgi:uncharacterized protein YjcR